MPARVRKQLTPPTRIHSSQSRSLTPLWGGSTPHLARCLVFTLLVLSLEEQVHPTLVCLRLSIPQVINLQIASFSYNKAFVLENFHLRYRPASLSSEPTQSCQIEPVLEARFPFPTTVRVSTSYPVNAEQTLSWRDLRLKAGTGGAWP